MNYLTIFAATSILNDPCEKGYVGPDKCISGGGESDILNLVANVVTWLTIAIGILSVVFIIISAVQIITSGGDTEKVKKARRTLLYSIIGLVVAILANVIISLVFNVADSFYQ